jgi:uncharacterized YigZ family protein
VDIIIDDKYLTIQKAAEANLRVKGSRFLGFAVPVDLAERFKSILQERTKRYHDATHHCWAYRILVDDKVVVAFSDAGEPSGTAGKPILSVIEGRQLLKVGVIVTRYFGGTKLGTGGLARAYADCAGRTLDRADVVTQIIREEVILRFPYEMMNVVMRIIDRYEAVIVPSNYEGNPKLAVMVPRSQVVHFQKELADGCRGNIEFTKV